jgi:hypothetical protein
VKERLEPGELLGRVEDDRADATAIDGAIRHHLPAPALQQARRDFGIVEELVHDRVARQRGGAQAGEGGEHLRLSSRDSPRESDECW